MAYWDLSPKAAPGVDGVTWEDYGRDLVANLRDLHDRVHSGRYRARPSRRAYIPKADGRQRPLGIVTVISYCPSCRDVSGLAGFSGRAGVMVPGSSDNSAGDVQWRWRDLVRRAAGLRCPELAMRARQLASVARVQGMQSLRPGVRRASSCPFSIQ